MVIDGRSNLCLAELFPSCLLCQSIDLFPIAWGMVLLIEAGSPSVQQQHSFTLHFHLPNAAGSRVSWQPQPAGPCSIGSPRPRRALCVCSPLFTSEIWGAACSKGGDCLSPVPPPFVKLKDCLSSRGQQQMVSSLVPPQSTARRGIAASHIPPDPHLSPLLSFLFSSPSASFSKSCLHLHRISDGNSFPHGKMAYDPCQCPRKKQCPRQRQLLSSACPLEPGKFSWLMASSWSGVTSPSP